MQVSDFIHPEDASMLQALKTVPVFPTLLDKVLQYGLEDIMWSENVTTNVRLSEHQMPEVYNRLPPICKRLGIPVPELYLQMSPIPNAWTSGHNRIYIVVTLGLIKRFQEDELDAVLAHECGHILCEHVLYSMVADSIYTLGDTMMDSFVGQIGSVAMKPVKSALHAWQRASELTADRVATFITSADTMASVLAKLDGIPKIILKDMDLRVWAEQGRDYESLKEGNSWKKIVRYISDSDMDHPYGPVRAYEAYRWEQERTNRKAIASNICPSCRKTIESNWAFCQSCGYKLK